MPLQTRKLSQQNLLSAGSTAKYIDLPHGAWLCDVAYTCRMVHHTGGPWHREQSDWEWNTLQAKCISVRNLSDRSSRSLPGILSAWFLICHLMRPCNHSDALHRISYSNQIERMEAVEIKLENGTHLSRRGADVLRHAAKPQGSAEGRRHSSREAPQLLPSASLLWWLDTQLEKDTMPHSRAGLQPANPWDLSNFYIIFSSKVQGGWTDIPDVLPSSRCQCGFSGGSVLASTIYNLHYRLHTAGYEVREQPRVCLLTIAGRLSQWMPLITFRHRQYLANITPSTASWA